MSVSVYENCGKMSIETARVVVIGAGAAGLSAANTLISLGFKDVLVLEASNRIGGRIHTAELGSGNGIVELGANWIHGMGTNPMYKLAKSRNLLTPLVKLERMEGRCYTENGQCLSKSLENTVWEIYQKLDEEIDVFYNDNVETSLSVGEFLQSRFLEECVSIPDHDKPHAQAIFNCILNFVAFHNGDELDRISLKYQGRYEVFPGGEVKLPRGFTGVVSTLSDNFTDTTIKLDTVVKHIAWGKPDRSDSHKVDLQCVTDGQVVHHKADHVIVTCSLGVIKDCHEKMFTPSLPPAKIQSIQRMHFGKVNKLFLEYDKPFWKKGSGSVKLAWSGTPTFRCGSREWYKAIFAFDEVLDNPTVLVAWIHGDSAKYMETLTTEEIAVACTALLRQFLGDASVPEPKRVLVSNWCSNPNTRGSYTYIGIGATDEDLERLSEPLLDEANIPRILFAGEATHQRWYSTTHGALSSGEREANRLHTVYKPDASSTVP